MASSAAGATAQLNATCTACKALLVPVQRGSTRANFFTAVRARGQIKHVELERTMTIGSRKSNEPSAVTVVVVSILCMRLRQSGQSFSGYHLRRRATEGRTPVNSGGVGWWRRGVGG